MNGQLQRIRRDRNFDGKPDIWEIYARGRLERSDEVNGLVGAWAAGRSVAEVMEALGPERADVPCSPVYGVDELLQHPQLLARDMIVRLPHPTLGEVVAPGIPVKLSATPGIVRRLGPELGEHNAEVYEGLLGLGREELGRLRAAEVICRLRASRRPPPDSRAPGRGSARTAGGAPA